MDGNTIAKFLNNLAFSTPNDNLLPGQGCFLNGTVARAPASFNIIQTPEIISVVMEGPELVV